MLFEGLFAGFFMFSMVIGMGIGLVIGLTLLGLIGGLIGLFSYNSKIIPFPNTRLAIFAGYLAVWGIFWALPFVFLMATAGGFSEIALFALVFLGIPPFHAAITTGVYTLLERRNLFISNYWCFLMAYFFTALILTPIGFFMGLTIFGPGFGAAF